MHFISVTFFMYKLFLLGHTDGKCHDSLQVKQIIIFE